MIKQLQRFLKIILLFVLSTTILNATNISSQEALNKATSYYENKEYKKALKYLEISYNIHPDVTTAGNLALTYEHIKDYKNAIKWYKKTFKMGNTNAAIDLGLLYKRKLQDYKNAIKWYKIANNSGNSTGAVYLGLLYKNSLKDYENAIKWYKKAIRQGNILARKNLGLLYHSQNNDLYGSAHMLGMINHPYKKDSIMELLKDDWKIDNITLLKAYKLQKRIFQDPYRDKNFEELLNKKII